MKSKDLKFNSKLIHSGHLKDEFNSVSVPIYQTSIFSFDNADHGADCFSGKSDGYIYTRLGNPTINALESCIADLENGFGGIATASGMGAVTTVYMAILEQGAHIICSDAVYGPSRTVLETLFVKFGVETSIVDSTKIENIKVAIKPNTRLIYIETPANPTIKLTDLKACSRLAKENNILLAVDNTFSSPYLQKPIDLGADIVVHSLTKFLNGHADIVGGIIVTATEDLFRKIKPVMTNMGPNIDPHQAYMVYRGIKTLAVRIEKAQENAMKIAEFLEAHPKIEWILYPGLKSHPQHKLAKQQMNGFGSMMSFGVKGDFKAGKTLINNVQLATLAVSLGGVETLIQHPASMTHSKVSEEGKKSAGITNDLVRYSVGIEDADDLIADLEQALLKV